jgi:two-component system response regulator DesR
MVRGALVALLGHERDIDVISELDQPEDIVAEARRLRPDVAVIDLGLISSDLSAARALRRDVPVCRTMILANMATPRALRLAIDAEVRGFVVKDAPPSLLADSIRRIAAGEYVIDSALASRALATPDGPLTERQCEVLGAAAEGASVPEIATRLCLSAGTVRNYLSASIAKLGARNRVDAIRIAQDAGWI